MFLYSCILLALACAVQASVIINVYEDGAIKESHAVSACDPRQCDRFCRSAGFRKGSCVGNRCRCTSFADLTDDKADYSVHDSCISQACNDLCRWLGFPGGSCVGDKCKCDNTDFIEINENKPDHSVRGSCNYQACDQLCRRLGFPGGACVGDRCKCDNFEPISIKGNFLDYLLKSYEGSKAQNTVEDCNTLECDAICRRLGYPGGTCSNGTCFCKKGAQKTEVEEEDEDDIENSISGEVNKVNKTLKDVLRAAVGDCDIVKCNDMCHRHQYKRGTCLGGNCSCYGSPSKNSN